MAKDVKALDPKNMETTEFEIGHVGPRKEFASQFKTTKDDKGNDVPVILTGHFYSLRMKIGAKKYVAGEVFISNAQLRETLSGKAYDDNNPAHASVPQSLVGSKIEYTGLVVVKEGEEFITHDGKTVPAKKTLMLNNGMTVKAGLSNIDKQRMMQEALIATVMQSMSADELADAKADLGL